MNKMPIAQRGVALLVALLVVALAVLLIGGLLDRGELTLARTRNTLRAEQADAYAHGLEAYAAQVLIKDMGENPEVDTSADLWAMPLPPQQVPGGIISAQMHDLNGCFNLNNLVQNGVVNSLWYTRLQNLLGALQLDPTLADAMVDWIDIDADIHDSNGAEDASYLAQGLPYRAANRLFSHVSELRLVRGISGETYVRLVSYVCALAPQTSINLNTASVPVLMSLDTHITRAIAERLWQDGQANWSGIQQIIDELGRQNVVLADTQGLRVDSDWFLLRSTITFDDLPLTYFSTIERRQGVGIVVLARYRGSDVMFSKAQFDQSLTQ